MPNRPNKRRLPEEAIFDAINDVDDAAPARKKKRSRKAVKLTRYQYEELRVDKVIARCIDSLEAHEVVNVRELLEVCTWQS